ncbi:MAG: alpha-glucosidase [Saprospiraceae bacterium]|nr:alpha-glucosidase [Saprospiraceae bacterium]
MKDWWKDIVMYQIYPRSFQDSNGDGIGDLRGIINRLEYIASLGIDLIWLSPIYQSPNDDNGYDISNYYEIHPEFGTMEDFDELLEGIHARGMKLIMDLVVNHTSDEHRWFEESRKSKDNPFRDYYIWKPGVNGGPPNNWQQWFGGSAWGFDQETNEYYLHLFTKKQPDLNWENPKVRNEIHTNLKFWLDKGIDGFRMDVISLLSKQLDYPNSLSTNIHYLAEHHYANGPQIHEFINEMYENIIQYYDVMTVGEGPGITKELANLYIGKNRRELNMIFQLDHMIIDHGEGGKFDIVNFKLTDLKKILDGWEAAIGNDGWNNIFLDNHDFPRMVSRFGNDGTYRIESAKMLNTFLLTQRGTPCIYMGSEIGMTNVAFEHPHDYKDVEAKNFFNEVKSKNGDLQIALQQMHVQGRDNVRVPMQWNDSKNAGFTDQNPWIKVNPNCTSINVKESENDPDSILHYFRKLTQFRKDNEVLRKGNYTNMDPLHEQIYSYSRQFENQMMMVICNFSDEELNLPTYVHGSYVFGNYDDAQRLRPWEVKIYSVN